MYTAITGPKIGIRLELRRNLGFNFSSSDEETWNASSSEMQTLGSFDYMRWAEISSLRELHDPISGNSGQATQVEGNSELVLFPPNSNSIDQINTTLEEFGTAPLAFLCRLHISSLAFDSAPSIAEASQLCNANAPELLEKVVKEAAKLIGHESVRPHALHVWTTLGGPDLVITAFPKSATELAVLNAVNSLVRTRSVKDVLPISQTNQGHAFSSVQSNLIFRLGNQLDDMISSDQFLRSEREFGMKFASRLTVGPGHELDVIKSLEGLFSKKQIDALPLRNALMSWGHRSIQLTFSELRQLVACVGSAGGSSGSEVDHFHFISAIRTTIVSDRKTIDLQANTFSHPPGTPQLSEELSKLLELIELRLTRLGKSFFGLDHRRELGRIFRTFRTAFRRNDRASSVRDLLPFFDQLARSASSPAWEKLYGKLQNNDEIATELDSIFSYLWRSLRNRSEDRSQPLDPSFPNTVSNGTNNLVNSYTVAAWVACFLLFEDNRQVTTVSKDCALDRFALATCTGTDGVVRVTSLFSTVFARENVESKLNGEWNSPLFLLRLSGPALYLPELTFVFCIHEMAEFSNWSRLPQHNNLCSVINRFALEDFCGRLTGTVETAAGAEIDDSAAFVRICIERASLSCYGESNGDDGQTLSRAIDHFFRNKGVFDEFETRNAIGSYHFSTDELEEFLQSHLRPIDYLDSLTYRLQKLDTLSLKKVQCVLRQENFEPATVNATMVPAWANILLDAKEDEQFLKDHVTLSIHIRETISDTAMTMALRHILEVGCRDMDTHINYLFIGIIENSVYSDLVNLQKNIDGLVVRWAVQLLSFCDPPKDTIGFLSRNIGRFSSRITRAVKDALDAAESEVEYLGFDFEVWLKNAWDSYQSAFYGYQFSLTSGEPRISETVVAIVESGTGFADYRKNQTVDAIIKEFRDLWQLATTDGAHGELERMRYEFTQKLWAKAQKFRVASIFSL